MFMKSPHILLSAVLGTLCLSGASPATAQSQPVQLADGWTYDGAVDRVDRVAVAQPRGETSVLTIEKRSPFEADKFLQVYRHFSALALRGKHIHMSYQLQTQVHDVDPPGPDTPRRTIVTRVQCNATGASPSSIFATFVTPAADGSKKNWPTGAYFKVPSDASECTLGFALARPLEMEVSKITFVEVKTNPPAPPQVEFPLPASAADLPTLELASPAPVK